MVLLLLGCLRFEELAASPPLSQVTGGPPRDSSLKIALVELPGDVAGRRDLKHTLKRPAFLQPAPAQADLVKLVKLGLSHIEAFGTHPQELVDFFFTGTGCLWIEFQGFPSLPPETIPTW